MRLYTAVPMCFTLFGATMQPNASLPNPAVPSDSTPRTAWRTSVLDVLASIVLIGLVLSAPAVYIADYAWSLQLTPVWEQLFGSIIAILLIIAAIKGQQISRAIRILYLLGGILIVAAVIDSLDGTPDILPFITLLLGGWGISFAFSTVRIMRQRQHLSRIEWCGGLLGLAATGRYLSVAVYYLIRNLTVRPQIYDHHILLGIGFLIASALRVIAPDTANHVPEADAASQ